MTRVLVVSESFAPGFRGGSIRALTHMVDRLGDRVTFAVLCRNRDPGDARPFDVASDRWVDRGSARVYYGSKRPGPMALVRLGREVAPDVVFLNSLFAPSAIAWLVLRRLGMVASPLVIAPEGEFGAAALAHHAMRKSFYLAAARVCGLFRGATWVARSETEAADLRARRFEPLTVLPVLGEQIYRDPEPALQKAPGQLRLVFLSRISAHKNPSFLLEVLQRGVTGAIDLDIVGPVTEALEWERCQTIMASLPSNVRVRYLGECTPDHVRGHLSLAHVFVLPTRGENHGFAIAEALEAGRPVMTTDLTPWHDLSREMAGWNLPLDVERWRAALTDAVAMDDGTYRSWSRGARARSERSSAAPQIEARTVDVFENVAREQAR